MTTALIHANGSFNRGAIKAEVARLVAAKADFVARYAGEPRAFWARRVREDAVTRVLRDASAQRGAFVSARLRITYSADERARLAELAAAADSAPISFNGNAEAARARGEAGAIREAAVTRALARDRSAAEATAAAARRVTRRAA